MKQAFKASDKACKCSSVQRREEQSSVSWFMNDQIRVVSRAWGSLKRSQEQSIRCWRRQRYQKAQKTLFLCLIENITTQLTSFSPTLLLPAADYIFIRQVHCSDRDHESRNRPFEFACSLAVHATRRIQLLNMIGHEQSKRSQAASVRETDCSESKKVQKKSGLPQEYLIRFLRRERFRYNCCDFKTTHSYWSETAA